MTRGRLRKNDIMSVHDSGWRYDRFPAQSIRCAGTLVSAQAWLWHAIPASGTLGLAWLRVDKAGSPDHDRCMPRSAFVSAVHAVDWCHLRSTYESGEIVRDIVLSLASRDETEVKWAWQQIGETVLRHQGTVYPATAAAAPFLCQIALDKASLWRAALAAELAFLSAGHDEPFAPAGTALAVRDAVRPYVGQLLRLWGTADPGLDMALVAVSAAFPAEAAVITGQLRDWFGRSEPPLRTALGLALGFHGLADEAVEQILLDEVGQSICWAIIRSGGGVAFVPNDSPFPRPDQEPYIDSPVPEAIRVAERLRAGTEERTSDFAPVHSFLVALMEFNHHLIDWPS
jgi:hypothetical protein